MARGRSRETKADGNKILTWNQAIYFNGTKEAKDGLTFKSSRISWANYYFVVSIDKLRLIACHEEKFLTVNELANEKICQ